MTVYVPLEDYFGISITTIFDLHYVEEKLNLTCHRFTLLKITRVQHHFNFAVILIEKY